VKASKTDIMMQARMTPLDFSTSAMHLNRTSRTPNTATAPSTAFFNFPKVTKVKPSSCSTSLSSSGHVTLVMLLFVGVWAVVSPEPQGAKAQAFVVLGGGVGLIFRGVVLRRQLGANPPQVVVVSVLLVDIACVVGLGVLDVKTTVAQPFVTLEMMTVSLLSAVKTSVSLLLSVSMDKSGRHRPKTGDDLKMCGGHVCNLTSLLIGISFKGAAAISAAQNGAIVSLIFSSGTPLLYARKTENVSPGHRATQTEGVGQPLSGDDRERHIKMLNIREKGLSLRPCSSCPQSSPLESAGLHIFLGSPSLKAELAREHQLTTKTTKANNGRTSVQPRLLVIPDPLLFLAFFLACFLFFLSVARFLLLDIFGQLFLLSESKL